MSTKPAYTLLELIVVIAIIGSVAVLGVLGMVSFRGAVEERQAVDEVLSVLRQSRSMAENNALTVTDGQIDRDVLSKTYYLKISVTPNFNNVDGKLERSVCTKTNNNNTFNCATAENLKSGVLKNVSYSFERGCDAVYFENLTGKILLGQGPNTVVGSGQCDINIARTGRRTKTIEIDATLNRFNLQD